MAAMVITDSGNGTITWAEGAGLDYTSANKYCTEFKPGGAWGDIRPVYAPGEDNGDTQNFGIRHIIVRVKVTYVAATESATAQAFDDDCIDLAAGTFSFTANGLTYAGSIMLEPPEGEQPKGTGLVSALFKMDANFVIKCVRPV